MSVSAVRRRVVNQVDRWLELIGGGGWTSEGRARAVREMQVLGAHTVLPLLTPKLADRDPEIRCCAITAILLLDAPQGVEFVLPMLRDADSTVRWWACGWLRSRS